MSKDIYSAGPYGMASSVVAEELTADGAIRLEDWFAPEIDRSGAPAFHFAHQTLAHMYGLANSKGEKVVFTAHWYWMAATEFVVSGADWHQLETGGFK